MYLKTVDDRFNVRPLIIIKITEASVESSFWLKVWIQLVCTTKKSKDSGHTNEKTSNKLLGAVSCPVCLFEKFTLSTLRSEDFRCFRRCLVVYF